MMQEQPEAAQFVGMFIGIVFGLLIGIAINLVICFFLYRDFEGLPERFRLMPSWQVWLLIIPLFNLVWNFFVFPKLSASYQNYFAEQGDTSAGDCNRGLGLTFAILAVCSLIPCIGFIAGLAALVVVIIYLVKMNELKNKVASAPVAQPEV